MLFLSRCCNGGVRELSACLDRLALPHRTAAPSPTPATWSLVAGAGACVARQPQGSPEAPERTAARRGRVEWCVQGRGHSETTPYLDFVSAGRAPRLGVAAQCQQAQLMGPVEQFLILEVSWFRHASSCRGLEEAKLEWPQCTLYVGNRRVYLHSIPHRQRIRRRLADLRERVAVGVVEGFGQPLYLHHGVLVVGPGSVGIEGDLDTPLQRG